MNDNLKVKKDNIKMMVNDPALKGKITTNITEPDGTVYWYIRFNTLLDPESVTKHTMNVTELNGYIINVIITYDTSRNLIILNPMDLYRQGEYYLLNISTKVRSNKGMPLSKPVHIMFKLVDDSISEFKVLKSDVKIPKPRQKPESVRQEEMEELMAAKAHSQEIDEAVASKAYSDEIRRAVLKPTLPHGSFGIRLQVAAFGLIWLVLSLFLNNIYAILIGLSILILGFFHICLQLLSKKTRSAINYARGASRFNKGEYADAYNFFDKSLELDPNNVLSKNAMIKIKAYL